MNIAETFVKICGAVPLRREFRFSAPVDWEISRGENWAVVGPNGAGKSLLGDILARRVALAEGGVETSDLRGISGCVRAISFRDIYSLADCRQSYYQQRWNSADADCCPTAEETFPQFRQQGYDRGKDLFGIRELLGRRLISLSSGELRKLLVARALSEGPGVLVLDNPFIGLDAASRTLLDQMLQRLAREGILQCVFIVSDPGDIPRWTDKVLPVRGRCLYPWRNPEDFLGDEDLQTELFGGVPPERFDFPPAEAVFPAFSTAIRMKGVKVRYNGRDILDGVDWVVNAGEKWALTGENGSGKSTLLSLVCGDNPQAYANDIALFDRRRGTGESIWDIKRRIGYVSPEMHAYYLERIPCSEVAASGFFDSVGLYRKCTDEQKRAAEQWMRVFGAEHLSDRFFTEVSYGQQRLVLLVRALVKSPDLLILDEPFHALDAGAKRRAGAILQQYCNRGDKTLIFVSHYREEIPTCVERELTLEKTAR